MKLEITDEKVRAAAEKCGTAKAVLQEMFPEAFEKKEPEYIKILERGNWEVWESDEWLFWVNIDTPLTIWSSAKMSNGWIDRYHNDNYKAFVEWYNER